MAQPAVSRVVLELEDRLGVKLLERTTRKVRLTESGRYLIEEAQEILSRIDIAENTVRLLASGTTAILRIGYTTITGHSTHGWRPSRCGWRRTGFDTTGGRCGGRARRSKARRSPARCRLR